MQKYFPAKRLFYIIITIIQELQPAPLGVQGHTPSSSSSSSQQQQQRVVTQLLAGATLEEINPEEALVEKTLLAIQDKVSNCIYQCQSG